MSGGISSTVDKGEIEEGFNNSDNEDGKTSTKFTVYDSKSADDVSRAAVDDSKSADDVSRAAVEDCKSTVGNTKYPKDKSKYAKGESKYAKVESLYAVGKSKSSVDESKSSVDESKSSAYESKSSAYESKSADVEPNILLNLQQKKSKEEYSNSSLSPAPKEGGVTSSNKYWASKISSQITEVRSALADFDEIKVSESDTMTHSEVEKAKKDEEPLTTNQTKSVEAASTQENTAGTSVAETSDLNVASTNNPKLNPETDSSDDPLRLQGSIEEVSSILDESIMITKMVLCGWLGARTNGLDDEMKMMITETMSRLVEAVKKSCALAIKCYGMCESEGAAHVHRFKSHISQKYNTLLCDVLMLHRLYNEDFGNNPPN